MAVADRRQQFFQGGTSSQAQVLEVGEAAHLEGDEAVLLKVEFLEVVLELGGVLFLDLLDEVVGYIREELLRTRVSTWGKSWQRRWKEVIWFSMALTFLILGNLSSS